MTSGELGGLLLTGGGIALALWGLAYALFRRRQGIRFPDSYIEEPGGSDDLPPDELVTVAHFSVPCDAEMGRLRLESEGIQCMILGEPEAGAGRRSLAVGPGIELRVRAADALRAAESLREFVR